MAPATRGDRQTGDRGIVGLVYDQQPAIMLGEPLARGFGALHQVVVLAGDDQGQRLFILNNLGFPEICCSHNK